MFGLTANVVSETVNVSVCTILVTGSLRWYFDTNFMAQLNHPDYVVGSPYFMHGATIGNVQNVTLRSLTLMMVHTAKQKQPRGC